MKAVVDIGVAVGDVIANRATVEAVEDTTMTAVVDVRVDAGDVNANEEPIEAGDNVIDARGTKPHALSDSASNQKALCAKEPKVNLSKATDIHSLKPDYLKPVEEVVICSDAHDKLLPNISPLNIDLSTASARTLLPNKGHAIIGQIITSSAGKLCRVTGICSDRKTFIRNH